MSQPKKVYASEPSQHRMLLRRGPLSPQEKREESRQLVDRSRQLDIREVELLTKGVNLATQTMQFEAVQMKACIKEQKLELDKVKDEFALLKRQLRKERRVSKRQRTLVQELLDRVPVAQVVQPGPPQKKRKLNK